MVDSLGLRLRISSDFDPDEFDKVALDGVASVLKHVSTQASAEELDEFHEAVLDWVMRHRGVAALAAHNNEKHE